MKAMTHKARILAAMRGEAVDRLPWAPRLDLWYRANRLAKTLPKGFEDAPLEEIVRGLGAARHAVIPDFQDLRSPEDDADRALGVYNLRTMPCRTVFENIDRRIRVEGDRTVVEYRTPAGTLRTRTLYDEGMRRAGITITHVEEYAFKDARDYEALGSLFENARVEPNREGYAAFAADVGDEGVAVGYVSSAASPMHLIQRELMPLERFFFEMYDHPDELARLAGRIGIYWDRLLEAAADSHAEVLLLGANYDASVTYPPFFARHLVPGLGRFADMLHARGKLLLTHTDGENDGLLEHYVASRIDVADSICPAPMTKLSMKQVRDAFDGRITIMGGIPSVALLGESFTPRAFDACLDRFFEEIGRGDRLVLGISDTTPPAADFSRLREIARRAQHFGPIA